MTDPDQFDPGGRFRAEVAASRLVDPMPGIDVLAANLGVPVDDVVVLSVTREATA